MLSLAALEVGVDLALEAPIGAVAAKSLALTDMFIALVAAELRRVRLRLHHARARPRGAAARSRFRHPEGYAIMQALIARGVIGDFRAPDVLRFGFTPLTLRYTEVWDAVAGAARDHADARLGYAKVPGTAGGHLMGPTPSASRCCGGRTRGCCAAPESSSPIWCRRRPRAR